MQLLGIGSIGSKPVDADIQILDQYFRYKYRYISTFLCEIEMKVGVCNLGARLNVKGVEQFLVVGLYAHDTVLLVESEGMPQRIVDEFGRVCKRRNLKVHASKSKFVVFERAREQTIDFAKPYKVESEAVLGCKIRMFGEENG